MRVVVTLPKELAETLQKVHTATQDFSPMSKSSLLAAAARAGFDAPEKMFPPADAEKIKKVLTPPGQEPPRRGIVATPIAARLQAGG